MTSCLWRMAGGVGLIVAGVVLSGCTSGAAGGGQTDALAGFQLRTDEAFDAQIANVTRSINEGNACLNIGEQADQETLDQLKDAYRDIMSPSEDFEMFVARADRVLVDFDSDAVCQNVAIITADDNRGSECFDPQHEVTRVTTNSENFEGLRAVYLRNPTLALNFTDFMSASAAARRLVADQVCSVQLGQDAEFDDLIARLVASANRRAGCRNNTPGATNENAVPTLKSAYYLFAAENQTLVEFARAFIPNYEAQTDVLCQ